MARNSDDAAVAKPDADERGESSSERPLPQKKWRPGALTLFLGFVAVLVLGSWGGYWLWKSNLQSQLDAEIAKIRERGEPVWFADVRPEPVADAENGIASYVHACRALSDDVAKARNRQMPATWTFISNEKDYGSFGQLTPKQLAEVRTMLSESPRPLAFLREALTKPFIQVDYDYDTHVPLNVTHNEVMTLRRLGDRLRAESALAIADSDLDHAAQCVIDQLLLIRAFRDDSAWYSQMTRSADLRHTMTSLAHRLGAGPLNTEHFQEIDALLAEIEPTFDFRPMLLTERARYLSAAAKIDRATLEQFQNSGSTTQWLYANFAALRIKDQLEIMRVFDEIIAIIDDPSPSATKRAEQLQEEFEAISEWSPLARELRTFPIYRKVAFSLRQQCVSARIAIRLAQIYHATGGLPSTLQDVADESLPAIEIGLVSQQPLIYTPIHDEELGDMFEIRDEGARDPLSIRFEAIRNDGSNRR